MILRNAVILLVLVLIGCLGGYTLATVTNDSSRTHWEELPPPPEAAVKIVELGGYGSVVHSITIEAASGRQYDCCGPWPSTWNQLDYKKTRYGPSCGQIESSLYDQLPAAPVDCAFISQFEWNTEQYHTALLPDGSLWRWHYFFGLQTILKAAGIGAFIGLVAGIGWIFVRKWRNKTAGKGI